MFGGGQPLREDLDVAKLRHPGEPGCQVWTMGSIRLTDNEAFLDERRRTRRFFNRMSPLYPIAERHLFPQYRDVFEDRSTGAILGSLTRGSDR